MNTKLDYYQILHVHPEAPTEIIRSSYRTLMQRLRMHPDLGGDSDSAALINEAYAILIEPSRRQAYDRARLEPAANDSRISHAAGERAASTYSDTDRPAATMLSCRFCHTTNHPNSTDADHAFCAGCHSPLYLSKQLRDDDLDRRAILRVPKNTTISYWTEWPQHQAHLGRTEDISLTGLRFRTPIPLEPAQVIRVDARMLQAVAEVTRIAPIADSWEVGIRFLSLHIERVRGAFVAHSV